MNNADQSPAARAAAAAGPDAANDDDGPAEGGAGGSAGPAGWDPFEVWRTRVRDARRSAAPSVRR
jgi:hypothetical protein